MIRTEAVKLTKINALAYKQKLGAGGAGLTIITPDEKAVLTINKRDGMCVPYGTGAFNSETFTAEVIREAMEATRSLSFSRKGKIAKVYPDSHCDETPVEQETEDEKADIDVMASAEYKAFIEQYTDKTGKFSYQLMNKDLIQFAAKSSVVKTMLAEKADVGNIERYVVKSRTAELARNKGMDDDMLTAFIDTLDSMNTRSAFTDLRKHLRGKLKR